MSHVQQFTARKAGRWWGSEGLPRQVHGPCRVVGNCSHANLSSGTGFDDGLGVGAGMTVHADDERGILRNISQRGHPPSFSTEKTGRIAVGAGPVVFSCHVPSRTTGINTASWSQTIHVKTHSCFLAAGEACGAVADGGLSTLGQGMGNSRRK